MKNKIKIIKIVIVALILVLLGELLYLGAGYYKREKDTIYYSFINSVISLDDGYVGVGTSDYRYSKSYKLSDYSKGLIYKYNSDLKVEDEVKFDLGYHSYFNDIVKYKDYYYVVGAVEMSDEHLNNGSGEGLILKYDKDFNIVWRKNIKILNDTELTKVRVLNNGDIIVIGKSIYESGMIGNHQNGGAVIMKFDSNGNEIYRNNYKGPYTGMFTDILVEKDGYVLSGVIYNAVGVVVKYDLKGNQVWNYHYLYTDNLGFTSINKLGNNYILTGSKLDGKNKTDYYKGSVVVINNKGKKINSFTYKSSNITRFNSSFIDNDYIYLVGATGKKFDKKLITDGLYLKLDKSFKVLKEEVFNYENNDSYNKIYEFNDKLYILGYTNSRVEEFKTNGKDYYPFIKELN